MAEIFSLVSAGVGIVAFIGQVSATLEKVSDARRFVKAKIQRRFWAFEYTPLSIYLSDCDDDLCNSRRMRLGFRVAFSQYGIPFAVLMGFEAISEAGMRTLQPTLRTQQVVKYASPGFKILWLATQDSLMLTKLKSNFRTSSDKNPRREITSIRRAVVTSRYKSLTSCGTQLIIMTSAQALVKTVAGIESVGSYLGLATFIADELGCPQNADPENNRVDSQDASFGGLHNSPGSNPTAPRRRRRSDPGPGLHGADVTQTLIGQMAHSHFGLHLSRRSQNHPDHQIYDMLMERWTSSSINKSKVNGSTVMHVVQTVQQARKLVQKGFNGFNAGDMNGQLAVHRHAARGRDSLVGFCIEHGFGHAFIQTHFTRRRQHSVKDEFRTLPTPISPSRLCRRRRGDDAAIYVGFLEQQWTNLSSQPSDLFPSGWYQRRIMWIVEVMRVYKVSVEEAAQTLRLGDARIFQPYSKNPSTQHERDMWATHFVSSVDEAVSVTDDSDSDDENWEACSSSD
ncbi:uncharacterized protein VDAG_05453 [Verticillium dahliae VdLs.17]|uniref:Uncharacterized protein n=2 Tax=Verticillium dahliae TaxID=27337 RepID=G2X5E8_VERDV|nr:uncharacterized protein VDAG_05453 [Verticillium dahliae VdLs.17]EGY14289.1 hypothetical protein VDAG_05453 [Verticillium dahliae VdLs.17]KAH6701058.1 hypothetical protein EV126DRAFT_340355 [Verticillium dahliae]